MQNYNYHRCKMEFVEKNMLEKKLYPIMVVVVLCCLLTVPLVLSAPNKPFGGRCKFSRDWPDMKNGSSADMMSSKDFKALVRLSSLFYQSGPNDKMTYYRAQNLKKVTLEEKEGEEGRRVLIIDMDCSRVKLHLRRNENKALVSDKMEFLLTNIDGSKELACSIEQEVVWANWGLHYRCDKKWTQYACPVTEANGFITWQLKSFEFELDGEERLTKDGQWTTKEAICRWW